MCYKCKGKKAIISNGKVAPCFCVPAKDRYSADFQAWLKTVRYEDLPLRQDLSA